MVGRPGRAPLTPRKTTPSISEVRASTAGLITTLEGTQVIAGHDSMLHRPIESAARNSPWRVPRSVKEATLRGSEDNE